ncbi:hypothetical protein QBC40DRAFT_254932 [Triangularia verruculosa]|uniref:Uncharacterized protein n=1 Tax=Triangularia verruculosa TaxID=2587418 RepID=A0AAN7AUH5_9PEZI|nr:hypothetical protein QBC40DRAFT_254932 [Triangularia verruculosa]
MADLAKHVPISVAELFWNDSWNADGTLNSYRNSSGPGTFGDNGGAIGLGWRSKFLQELYEMKYVRSKVFGLFLGQDGGKEGSLVLDGVDLGKFTGPLELLSSAGPQWPPTGYPEEY